MKLMWATVTILLENPSARSTFWKLQYLKLRIDWQIQLDPLPMIHQLHTTFFRCQRDIFQDAIVPDAMLYLISTKSLSNTVGRVRCVDVMR